MTGGKFVEVSEVSRRFRTPEGEVAGWMAKEDWDTPLNLQKTDGGIQVKAPGGSRVVNGNPDR